MFSGSLVKQNMALKDYFNLSWPIFNFYDFNHSHFLGWKLEISFQNSDLFCEHLTMGWGLSQS